MTIHKDSLDLKLFSSLENLGFKAGLVSITHLQEARDTIEGAHKQGLIDEDLYREYLSGFDFTAPNVLSEARSIIVVAALVPALQVTFMRNGQPFQAIVPPTYNHDTDQQVSDCLIDVLKPEGYQIVAGKLPKKLLAARSGLARYGKNNITYVNDMGSYHRLTSFFTDAPLLGERWEELQMLDQCQKCEACVKNCPTGAISSDRFLLHAEKCLTFHNEMDKPFPKWIDPSWHNCLIGCMFCQNVCPANKPSVRRIVPVATFSDEETELILRNAPKEDLSQETSEKLEATSLLDGYELVSRNLNALLSARK
jgi:epoxyqueuosine reductase